MDKKIFKKILFLVLVFSFLSYLRLSFAAPPREVETRYPQIPGLSAPPQTVKTMLPDYVKYIFELFIVISGVVVFAAFIRGTIRIYTSIGNPAARRIANEEILSALLGLLIILASFMVSQSINPQLVQPQATIEGQGGVTLYESASSDSARCETGDDDYENQKAHITVSNEDIRESEAIDGLLYALEFNSEPGTLDVIVYPEVNYGGNGERIRSEDVDDCYALDFPAESIKLIWHLPGIYLCNADDGYTEQEGEYMCDGRETHLSYNTGLLSDEFDEDVQGLRLEGQRILMEDYGTEMTCLEGMPYIEGGLSECYQRYKGTVEWDADTNHCWCHTSEYAAFLHEDPNWTGRCEIVKRPSGDTWDPTEHEEMTMEEFMEEFTYNIGGASSNPYTGQDTAFDLFHTSSVSVFSPGEPGAGGVWLCQEPDPRKSANPKCAGPYKSIMGTFGDEGAVDGATSITFGHDNLNNARCTNQWTSGNGVSSVVIDGNYIVTLFADDDFKGQCEVFMRSDPDLSNNVMGSCCTIVSTIGRSDCASSAIILPVRGSESVSGWTPAEPPEAIEDWEVGDQTCLREGVECTAENCANEENWGDGGDCCCTFEESGLVAEDCPFCTTYTGECSCREE